MDLRFESIDKKETMLSTSPIRKINNLAVYLGDPNDEVKYVPPKHEKARKLHSVLFFLERYFPRSKVSHLVESCLSDFKMVQVLDLGGLVFSKLDESIGKLKHLKYLGFT